MSRPAVALALAAIFVWPAVARAFPSSGDTVAADMRAAEEDTFVVENGWWVVPFSYLTNYRYDPPRTPDLRKASDSATGNIPDRIRRLHGKKVKIEGFMMPMEMAGRSVKRFLLLANQNSCCYGAEPIITEWISVRIEGGQTTKFLMDIPLHVYGRFEVGEVYDGSFLESIYGLEASKIEIPKDIRDRLAQIRKLQQELNGE